MLSSNWETDLRRLRIFWIVFAVVLCVIDWSIVMAFCATNLRIFAFISSLMYCVFLSIGGILVLWRVLCMECISGT